MGFTRESGDSRGRTNHFVGQPKQIGRKIRQFPRANAVEKSSDQIIKRKPGEHTPEKKIKISKIIGVDFEIKCPDYSSFGFWSIITSKIHSNNGQKSETAAVLTL